MKWSNFFVTSISAQGTEGHILSKDLANKIKMHDGSESYHCAFDLEPRSSFNEYDGIARPTFNYVWFDFDSKEISNAHEDAKKFVEWINYPCFICFSGSKGFHVGVPLGCFELKPSKDLPKTLNAIAKHLKKNFYPTLDTTIYNPNRKFRVLGSKHPKTGLFKRALTKEELFSSIEVIKQLATSRGPLEISDGQGTPLVVLENLVSIVKNYSPKESISLEEWRRYRTPKGDAAFATCLFLAHCKDEPQKISEPEWYAAASIVGRFENGRAQFHGISKGHPSYSKTQTDEKLEQALQASGPRTCEGIDALWGGCAQCPQFGRIKSPIVIMEPDVIPTEATGFYDLITGKNGELKKLPNYGDLLRAFKRDTEYFRDTESEYTYAWDENHYRVFTNTEVKAFSESQMMPQPTQKIRNEFLDKVLVNEIRPKSYLSRFFFETIKGKLNLKNGVLDIVSGELSPHSKDIGFRYVLPYAYDPTATAPKFEKFLSEITLGRAGLQKTLLEFMGYCLWPQYDDHCFLWLSGGGRNGKSTFMEVLKLLVGHENTAAVLFDHFDNPHYLEMLNHKLVNLSEESDSGKIPMEVLSKLKTLSAGGDVPVDKKFGHPYTMRNTAKLVFAANSAPLLGEAQDAIKSRMIVVPFELRLEDHVTGENHINPNLVSELEAELPGILNVVLRALKDFIDRPLRRIYRDDASKNALNEIVRDSDPVERWVQDNVKLCAITHGTSIIELFEDFKKLTNEGNDDDQRRSPNLSWFSRMLRQKLGNRILISRQRTGKDRQLIVYGISLTLPPENHF